LSFLAMS